MSGIYFIFLKNVLDQTLKAFNTKLGPQQDQESSYQVRQIFVLIWELLALILIVWQLVEQLIYTSLLLIIILHFTYGEREVCSTIRKAQNIVNMIVDLHIFYRYAQHNHLGYLMMEEESLEAEPH